MLEFLELFKSRDTFHKNILEQVLELKCFQQLDEQMQQVVKDLFESMRSDVGSIVKFMVQLKTSENLVNDRIQKKYQQLVKDIKQYQQNEAEMREYQELLFRGFRSPKLKEISKWIERFDQMKTFKNENQDDDDQLVYSGTVQDLQDIE